MGELLLAAGKPGDAARHFEAALAANPEHLLALWNLARIDLAEGRAAAAKDRCRKALEVAADEGGAHFVLGLIAEAEGRPEDARKRFALAARFEPDEPEFRAALARLDAAQR
jgi:tetratricopeptide (TPR) repeat protein